jgi:tRNA A37 N6-isopentenylltransferase MiaA
MSSQNDRFVPRGFLEWDAAWKEVQKWVFADKAAMEPEWPESVTKALEARKLTGEELSEHHREQVQYHVLELLEYWRLSKEQSPTAK